MVLLTWAWAWLSPWLAPAVLTVLPWLGWFRGLPAALRVVSYVGVAGAVLFGAYWLLSEAKSKEPTPASVALQIDKARLEGENEMLHLSIAFRDRLEEIMSAGEQADRDELAQLRLQMEKAREAVKNADAPCFVGDGLQWLLDKRKY